MLPPELPSNADAPLLRHISAFTARQVVNLARPLLSVVAPAFEEETALPHFHFELMKTLEQLASEYHLEVIYVDDGSSDGTVEVLRGLAATDSRVRYLSLSRNFGQQAALTAGLEHAAGDLVVCMDADLQHPPEVIPLLLREWQAGADIVNTIRADDPNLSMWKRLSSRLFYKAMRWMSGAEVRAAAADFRLMTRPAVDALLQLTEAHRFIRGMVQWLGFPCREVHFTPRQRVAGATKYSFRKMLSLGVNGMLSFSRVPLRISMILGLLIASIGAVCSIYLVVGALFDRVANPTFWVLLAALNLIGGSTMMGLGILGEYVGRIYEQVKQRPTYLLKESGNLAAARGESAAPESDANWRRSLSA
jgi:polyisoprenyl-phosphate glycosyltransferase